MMKNIGTLNKVAVLALLVGACGTASASEQFGVVGKGRVHFSGEIYQPACRINVNHAAITSNCFEQGEYHQQSLSTSDVQTIAFNNRRSEAQLEWLSDAKREGILTVNYR
ncbi:type 1 fimbrial protein [Candidatus Pantoea formicae]|uniref:type 1 fimbrial protein n=1 Tax=Candidatus Pantoea formicae TaxID=2608355 RepID=UPI003EDAEB61